MICGGCGHFLDETVNPAEAPAWVAESFVCNGCAAKERRTAADNDGDRKPPPGVRYTARNRAH